MNRKWWWLCVAWLGCLACNGSRQPLEIDQHTINIGTVTDNNLYEGVEFRLVNTGKENIEIEKFTRSVSYLGVQKKFLLLKPGDTTYLPVAVLTNGMGGKFKGMIEMHIKGEKKPIPLFVEGYVKETPKDALERCIYPFGQLLFDKKEWHLEDVVLGKEYTDTVMIYNPTDEAYSVKAFYTDGVRCEFSGSRSVGKKAMYMMVYFKVTEEEKLGKNLNVIRFTVGREPVDDHVFVVDANVRENFEGLSEQALQEAPVFRISDEVYDFGTISAGTEVTHQFVIHNEGKRDLILRKITPSCGCTAAVPEGRVIRPGESTNLNVSFKSGGRHGAQQKSITLYCNDPRQPEIKLWIKGNVE